MRKLIVASVAALSILVTPLVAQSEEITCRGKIESRTVDNLRVPQGASCTLNGTKVEGTIKVENGAGLTPTGVRSSECPG
jgi:hypothetical protein